MDRLHARYPFFESARTAVENAGIDLLDVVENETAVVRRSKARIKSGLSEGHIGDPRRNRVELLSYPVARVLISLIDDPMATDTYARAEAATARQRFEADIGTKDTGRSIQRPQLTISRLLDEFNLSQQITQNRDGSFQMDVSTYLQLSRNLEDQKWRLVERAVTTGEVPVTEEELLMLLEEAVVNRVTEGLPLQVPDSIADTLAEEKEELSELLAGHEFSLSYETIDEPAFPPCMTALLRQIRSGDSVELSGQFAVVAFLAGMEMDKDEVYEFIDQEISKEEIAYQLAHLRDKRGGEYAPPSCTTMVEYDLCVNKDELCKEINHPIEYYERKIDQ